MKTMTYASFIKCKAALLKQLVSMLKKSKIFSTYNNLCTCSHDVIHNWSNNLVQLALCTRKRNNLVRWLIGKSLKTHLVSPKWHMSFGPSRILTLFLLTRNVIFIILDHPQLSFRAFFLLFFWGLASVQTSKMCLETFLKDSRDAKICKIIAMYKNTNIELLCSEQNYLPVHRTLDQSFLVFV